MRLLRSGVLASLIFFTLFFATVVAAQEAPTRFEAGGNLMAVRGQFPSVGTGVEGGMNFGRHLSLDAAFDASALEFSAKSGRVSFPPATCFVRPHSILIHSSLVNGLPG